LKNLVPTGEPRYIAGPQETSGVEEGVYLGIVTVNMPGRALAAQFDGVETLAVQGPDGQSHVIGFQLEIPRGGERTVVARFRLPGDSGDLRIEPSARVPPIDWVSGTTAWIDKSARVLTWSPESVRK
jgi:hypothetical protein